MTTIHTANQNTKISTIAKNAKINSTLTFSELALILAGKVIANFRRIDYMIGRAVNTVLFLCLRQIFCKMEIGKGGLQT
jgi:hypothetical protein